MKQKYNLLDEEGNPIEAVIKLGHGKQYHIIEYGVDDVAAMREVLTAKGISCMVEVVI